MDRRILDYTGKLIDVFDLKPDDVSLAHIAHALATKTRFNGSARVPYSIAQHCCHAVEFCRPPLLQEIALLHDAEEAYLVDNPGPWSETYPFNALVELKTKIRHMIWDKYIPSFAFSSAVGSPEWDYKWIDNQLCTAEIRNLIPNWQATGIGKSLLEIDIYIDPWSWEKSEWMFLDCAKSLDIRDK